MSVVDPGGYVVYFDSCGGGQDDLVRSFPPGLERLRPMSLDEDQSAGCSWWDAGGGPVSYKSFFFGTRCRAIGFQRPR